MRGDAPPRRASTTAEAPKAAAPATPQTPSPEPKRPFALALRAPKDIGIGMLADAVGAWFVTPGEMSTSIVTVFELSGSELVRLGERQVEGGYGVLGLRRFGSTVHVAAAGISGRTGVIEYLPLDARAAHRREPDRTAAYFSRVHRVSQSQCDGKPTKGEPRLAATDIFDVPEGVVVVGKTCEDDKNVIHIRNRTNKTTIVPLDAKPEFLETNFGLVLLEGAKAPAVFDGRSGFIPLAIPKLPPGADKLHKAPDGAFIVHADSLEPSKPRTYFIADGEGWKPLALPDGRTNFELEAGPTTLWAVVDGSAGSPTEVYRYHSGPGSAPAAVDATSLVVPPKQKTPAVVFGSVPLSQWCSEHAVVVLYGFTKVTPDDYDFPLTRKALKGKTQFNKVRFVVTEAGGQKFFVGKASSIGEAKALADVIERGVQGSKPQVVCADPTEVRTVDIDLATGEVRKGAPKPARPPG
jgi:hypothetical protein